MQEPKLAGTVRPGSGRPDSGLPDFGGSRQIAIRPAGRRGFMSYAITIFIGLYLMCAAGMTANLLTPVADTGKALEGGSGGLLTASWMVLYGLSLPLILLSLRPTIAIREAIILLIMAMAMLGVFWSEMPEATMRYSLSLVFNMAFAWMCYRRLSMDEFERILVWALNIMVLLGLLLALARVPNAYYYDADQRGNALGTQLIRGLFSHKIYAGFYASMAFSINIVLLRGYVRYLFAGLCVLLVLIAGSSVGIVTLLVSGLLIYAIPFLANRQWRVLIFMAAFFAILIGVMSWSTIAEEVTGALGRDMTLTGRTTLWQFAIQFWSEKPILGWAYGGIFGDAPNAPGNIVNVDKYYHAPHFHDVYLQVAAEMGTVGLILFLTMVIGCLVMSLSNAWRLRRPVDVIASIFIICLCFIGTVMNIGMRYNELSTILLVYFFLAAPAMGAGRVGLSRRRTVTPPRRAPLAPNRLMPDFAVAPNERREDAP